MNEVGEQMSSSRRGDGRIRSSTRVPRQAITTDRTRLHRSKSYDNKRRRVHDIGTPYRRYGPGDQGYAGRADRQRRIGWMDGLTEQVVGNTVPFIKPVAAPTINHCSIGAAAAAAASDAAHNCSASTRVV